MSESNVQRWQPRTISVVSTSHKSLEEIAETARKQGYSEGFAKGQAEAQRNGEQAAGELAALWRSMKKPMAHQDNEVSEHLLSLVISLAGAVVERELTTDAEFIKSTLDSALMHLSESEASLTVTLNPADKALLERLLEADGIHAELKVDAAMLRGGCRVARGHALVDATIESRIQALIEQITATSSSTEASTEMVAVLDADRIQSIADRFSGNQDG